jgi:hypothetical protein
MSRIIILQRDHHPGIHPSTVMDFSISDYSVHSDFPAQWDRPSMQQFLFNHGMDVFVFPPIVPSRDQRGQVCACDGISESIPSEEVGVGIGVVY